MGSSCTPAGRAVPEGSPHGPPRSCPFPRSDARVPEFVLRTSTHSGGRPDSRCVEVATNMPGTVAVRDSGRPAPARLRPTPEAWRAFPDPAAAGRR
ncbi:DUF397 domain-containing protein [Streptomyces calidiresistens]|uniref:DUF397 domain-containing protein n=1 Tax=Streptomyces calidiresistens TaxID=1485586 RepID=UPI002B216A84|nr:DUF397 domain-containing protein [Streptomyces calidiresistens]